MKNKFVWLGLSFLLVAALLLASCTKSSTTSTSTSNSTSIKTTISTTTKTTSGTTQPPTIITSTTVAGNWWDSLGVPQYGGEMVFRSDRDVVKWDPYFSAGSNTFMYLWLERLLGLDWTVNPKIYNFRLAFTPDEYVKGLLAASYEFTDPSTFVVHLHQGIHWQNISPANGREFTADDVVWNTDRMYGKGDGFTKASPYLTGSQWQDLISVTATDKYTAVFKWKTPNPEVISELMKSPNGDGSMSNPEAVQLWGDVNDWHHSIGTGPFIVKDYVSGSSVTVGKNPNYWGFDDRYPKNQLPYIDTLKILIIPDSATALAALRTGKIDILEGVTLQNTQTMQKTNPEILLKTAPANNGLTVDPNHTVKPFNDVRVLTAMQMAIDLPTIAKTYYGGLVSSDPVTLIIPSMIGWAFPYSQWPQDLKDQFTYNTTASKQLLAAAGYTSGFKTNVIADASGDLDLLQVVKSYWAQIGIDMAIQTMDSATWMSTVQTSHKFDQLAYRAAGSADLTGEPSMCLNVFSTGIPRNYMMASDPVFDTLYGKYMAATSVDECKAIIKQACEIYARQHFVISLLEPNSYALYQPWFKGYEAEYGSVSGSGAGPQWLGFYASRFWIDQNLKASIGH